MGKYTRRITVDCNRNPGHTFIYREFIQEQEKTESQEEGSFRPLDAEEIAEALDKEESENAPDEETNSLTADDVREIIELASEKFRKAFSNIVTKEINIGTTKKEN